MPLENPSPVKIIREVTEATARFYEKSNGNLVDEKKKAIISLGLVGKFNLPTNFLQLKSKLTTDACLPGAESAALLASDSTNISEEKATVETIDISDDDCDDNYSETTEILKPLPVCDICNKWFTKKSSLKAHYQIHAGIKPFICEVCYKTFSKKCALDTHSVVHTGERKFFCEICDKRFARSLDLRKHLLTHTDQKPHVCKLCSKGFNDKSNLRKHRAIHANKKHHKCSICQQAFSQKEVLLNHLKNHYLEGKNVGSPEKEQLRHLGYLKTVIQKHFHKCDDCGKLFLRKSRLEKHKLAHRSQLEKPHSCEVCRARFESKDDLHDHLLNHVVLTFNNDTIDHLDLEDLGNCLDLSPEDDFDLFDDISISAALDVDSNFNFDLLDDLTLPSSPIPDDTPTDSSSENDKTCNICSKKFTRKSSLKDHYLTHSGEKPHKCKICEKSFSQKVTLKRHILTHSGARPFVCKVCNKSFARKTYLQKHYISHSSKNLF